jgi:hypothetical protein
MLFKNKREASMKRNFTQLTTEDFINIDMMSLYKIWQENNKYFLEIIKSKEIPFFGLHGAPGTNIEGIKNTKKAWLNIATFYKKSEPLKFLADLLTVCGYAPTYAFYTRRAENDHGEVIVLNVEREGKNISGFWQPLCGTRGYVLLGLDHRQDFKLVNLILAFNERGDDYPARSSFGFNPNTYDSKVKGYITTQDLESVVVPITLEGNEAQAKLYIRERMISQVVLYKTLQLLNVID